MSRVLVVEDDEAIMETLIMFLDLEGHEVCRARSVGEALDVLDRQRPELILLDYMLQDGTAEPVTRRLRERYGAGTPVILLTATEKPLEKMRFVSADTVISKPFDLDVLIRAMALLLPDRHESRDAVAGHLSLLPVMSAP